MKQGQRAAVLCTAALALILLAGVLYFKQQEGNSSMQTEPSLPPGTLTGVMYSYSGGMTVRNDFFIWLSPEAIVETFYYPEEPPKGMAWHECFTEKEDVPITAEQWADVEQVVLELYPLMEPKPEPRIDLWSSLGRLLGGVKDGVSSSSITLIWDTEAGAQRIKYFSPNDKRISTLAAMLRELADPIGREIPRYDP